MSELLDLCRKYFGSRDLYEVLQISKSSDSKQVKKAYHKVSLLVHPDRVDENEKIEATEKFKVLGKVHSILNDKDKRKVYDETGSVGDDETADRDWNLYWDIIYKNITVEDISNYEKKYKESDEELQDLKRAYLGGKGDMDLILELVPFTNTDEEPRLKKLIQGLIDRGEVPAFPAFTHESAQKKANRKRKWEREAREAAALEKERGYMGGTDDDLKKLLLKKQEQRSKEYDSFFEALASKYGGKDTKRRSNPKRNKKQ